MKIITEIIGGAQGLLNISYNLGMILRNTGLTGIKHFYI
jgi:hypothetical protein